MLPTEDREHKDAVRNKPLRGKQQRSSGSGLVNRAVCLAGLPVRDQRFFYGSHTATEAGTTD